MTDESGTGPLPPDRRNRPLYNEFELWIQLGGTVDAYSADRGRYWQEQLEGADWTLLKQLREDADVMAALIRKRAMALQNIGEPSEVNAIYRAYQQAREDANERARQHDAELVAQLRDTLTEADADELLKILRSMPPDEEPDYEREGDHPLRLIWEELCIQDAWDVVDDIPHRVRRTLQLERLIDNVLGRRDPPERCVRFLALVSRCYIFGFNTECVVMCRSALEQAFRSILRETHYDAAGVYFDEKQETLAKMIRVAAHPKNGPMISSDDFQGADKVRERGSKAVHYEPDATRDVLGTIEHTLRVIDRLSAVESS